VKVMRQCGKRQPASQQCTTHRCLTPARAPSEPPASSKRPLSSTASEQRLANAVAASFQNCAGCRGEM
jgi:hypothetical protein